MNRLAVLIVSLLACVRISSAQSAEHITAAEPPDPIAATLAAFDSHRLVAIGDDHGNEQVQRFRLALIRDPRFARRVQDIVIEFGNSRYQDAMDRFIRGESVTDTELRRIWQDTTQPGYEWDLPIYEEFIRAVRSLNETLPASTKLRIVLGDPPIEWERIAAASDLTPWVRERDAYAAKVIRLEVLDKGHRALIIYGSEHVAHNNGPNLVGQLEAGRGTRVFTIIPETHRDLESVYPPSEGWRVPTVTLLKGTKLGAIDAFSPGRTSRMEDRADALLYVGPLSAQSKARMAPSLCADAGYMQMRLSRMAMISTSTPASSPDVERLKDSCNTGRAVADSAPELTAHLRSLIAQAAGGDVDPTLIAPESQERLLPLLKQIGARFLRSAGTLQSLDLLTDDGEDGNRRRAYRAVFANGQKVLWTVRTSSSGRVISVDPRPE